MMDVLLAHELADRMTVEELRKWCSEHGVVRERGDDKLTTAKRAVEQDRVAVLEHLLEDEALSRRPGGNAAHA